MDPALDHAGRLGAFLDKTITELKPMNKFEELAQKVASSQKALDNRADKLIARLDKLNSSADAAFTKHESAVDQAESGIASMEAALSGLIGHNGAPNA